MAAQALVHIHQPLPQLGDLALRGPLPLGQAHQGQQLRFAVMQHRPVGIGLQQALQPLPEPFLPVLLQG